MWHLASLIFQHIPTFAQNTNPGHLVPLSTATETVTEHIAGFFCITTLYCSGPFPSGDSVVLQAGYSSLTITVSDRKKVKSWVKKQTTKAALRRQGEAMTDRQKHQEASTKALKGRKRSLSFLGKDSNVWNADWHTVTTASACWKKMLLSIFCVWANTNTYFSQSIWAWQFLSSSLLPFPEVCHAAMPTKCAESITWQCFAQ